MNPLHHARGLLRRPRRLTFVTLLLVAVTAGAEAVVVQVVDRLVLRPLPLPDAGALQVLTSALPEIGIAARSFEAFSGPELAALEQALEGSGDLLTFDLNSVRMLGDDLPTRLFMGFAWNDPGPVLGAPPLLGRTFTAQELERGLPVLLLSHAAWVREFGADSTLLGQGVRLDEEEYAVVGVLPPYVTLYGVDGWVPMGTRREAMDPERRQFNAILRLARGVDGEGLATTLATRAPALSRDLAPRAKGYDGWILSATPLTAILGYSYADEAVLTAVGAGLILLLAAVNMAGLGTLASLSERRGAAIRLALGSSPAHIRSAVLGRSFAVAAAGGSAGLALAWLAVGPLARRLPEVIQPSGPPLELEGAGISAVAATTLLSGALLALGGLAGNRGLTPREILAPGAAGLASRGRRRALGAVVTVQMALAVSLTAGALATTLGVTRLVAVDPGFDAHEVAYMRVSLPPEVYGGEEVPLFFSRAMDAAASLPGVEGVAAASQVLPSTRFTAQVETESDESGRSPPRPFHTVVAGDYFRVHGIEMADGRPILPQDRSGTLPVAVVSESAGRLLFPRGRAVGQRLRVRATDFDSGWLEVVGVSRDIRHRGPSEEPLPEVFTVHGQAGDRYRQMFLLVRAPGDPMATVPGVRRRIQELDPSQPLYSVGTPGQVLEAALAPRRVAAGLLAAFALVAVGLAALGLHAVLRLTLVSRRRELAVRAALGAAPSLLRGEVIRQLARLSGAGAGLGLAAAAWLGVALRARTGLAAGDTFLAALVGALGFALVGVAAALHSIHRAGRIPPAETLRRPD